MINQDNYLDMFNLFINEVLGSVHIFVILGIIILLYATTKLKFPWQAQSMVLVLFIAITWIKTGNAFVWAYTLLVIGLMFYYKISKISGGRK